MQPDEAMKIMHIEKHEMNVAKVEEVSSNFITVVIDNH